MNATLERLREKRVVLAHDWLTGMRGGERVLETLCRLFPRAEIVTLLAHPPAISDTILQHRIHTSFLQRIPGIHLHYRHFLPLFPLAVNRLRLPPADLVISTSHCVAKSVRPPAGARHVCYCFTPMRYAWLFHDEYLGRLPGGSRSLIKPLLAVLRRWDRRTAARVDRFVAISRHVSDRIDRFYGRPADVVFPPVNTDYWTPHNEAGDEDFDLLVSALVPYKRVDLAVETYRQSGRRLQIVGSGGELERLKKYAAPNIVFHGRLPDAMVRDLYRRCRMLVFPGEEDFGIVPLEAQACGRPVVAYARGGALETVDPGVSGVFFDKQTPAALAAAVETCRRREWDGAAIRRHALRFAPAVFINDFLRCLQLALREPISDSTTMSCAWGGSRV